MEIKIVSYFCGMAWFPLECISLTNAWLQFPGTKPCGCEGNSSTVQYVKDRDNKLLFKWKKPKLNCGDGVIIPEPKVIPAGAKSPMEFGKGPHSITYTFSPSSGDKKRPNVKCSVSVDIGGKRA